MKWLNYHISSVIYRDLACSKGFFCQWDPSLHIIGLLAMKWLQGHTRCRWYRAGRLCGVLGVCRGLYGNIEIGVCKASLDGVLDCLCQKCGILQERETLIEVFEDHFHGFKSLWGNAGLKGGVRVCRGRSCHSCIHVGVLFHNGTLQLQAYLSRLHNQTGCDSLSASFLSWLILAVSYQCFEERILVRYL